MNDDLSALKGAEWPMQRFHWFSFPITMPLHKTFGFNIQAWLCLNIYAWTSMYDDLSAHKGA